MSVQDDKIIDHNDINSKTVDKENEFTETYGAVYSPSADGNGYSCEKYSVDETLKSDADNTDENRNKSVKDKAKDKRRTPNIVFVSVTIVMCIVLSLCAALASALLTREYFRSYYEQYYTVGEDDTSFSDQTDSILIDTSKRPGYTTEIATPGQLMSMETAIAAVKDSVVEITTETVKSGFGSFSQYVVSGAGSGVIISEGGYIVTNNHVIEGASNIKVRLTNGSEYDAVLIGTDAKTDVAVIAITPEEGVKLSNAIIGNSETLSLGQTVIAIGNPLGELGGTVTDGIISSLAREVAVDSSGTMTLLQTNAAVNPGNSGGGLFDLYGRLIGVVNAKSTGEGIEGISFAIPIATAWDVAQQLIDKGYVSGRPSLGVTLQEIQYGHTIFGDTYSFVVVSDHNGVEGFKNDDVILVIDNREVSTLADVSAIVSTHKIGDKVTVKVRRDKRDYDIEVTIIEHVPTVKDQINTAGKRN